MKSLIKNVLKNNGVQVQHYPGIDLKMRVNALNHFGVNVILDVGAANGEWAEELFKAGYRGKIISFEPLRESYVELEKRSKRNPGWQTHNMGFSDVESEMWLNIAGNKNSSSIVEMLPYHSRAFPQADYIGKQKALFKRLDDMYDLICDENDVVYVKIDVQGAEGKVLAGATASLKKIKGIQIEMNLVPLYEGAQTYRNTTLEFETMGFTLWAMELGAEHLEIGRQLQFDGIFFRT